MEKNTKNEYTTFWFYCIARVTLLNVPEGNIFRRVVPRRLKDEQTENKIGCRGKQMRTHTRPPLLKPQMLFYYFL